MMHLYNVRFLGSLATFALLGVNAGQAQSSDSMLANVARGFALDQSTPRALRIARFRVTPRELAKFTDEVMKTPFQLVRLGGLEDLRTQN
jgi:hypothetical protein